MEYFSQVLRDVNKSMSCYQNNIASLTSENHNLKDALAALHESHETRTEASGTESELVRRTFIFQGNS